MSGQVSRKEWFRTMLAQYEQRLIRYTRRITLNHESAREVVQEAYLRLWKLEDRVPENITAWLFHICRNQALDVLRRNKNMRQITASGIGLIPEPRAGSAEPGDTRLIQALKLLPDNQQEVIRLKFQEELSYSEISDVTGLSASNVGYLLHTGIKNLRERMAVDLSTRKKGGDK